MTESGRLWSKNKGQNIVSWQQSALKPQSVAKSHGFAKRGTATSNHHVSRPAAEVIMISTNFLACLTPIFLNGLLALKVTSPTENSQWEYVVVILISTKLTWSNQLIKPSMTHQFTGYEHHNMDQCAPTGFTQAIKQNIASSDGKFDISGVSSMKACSGYQINLVASSTPDNGAHNAGILAQSAPFNVTQTSGPSMSESLPLAGANSTANTPAASTPVANTTSPTQSTSSTGAPKYNSGTAAPGAKYSFAPRISGSLQKVTACALLFITFMLA
ncbi:hypothetical protein H4Q26_011117 [Puccinia striiformis f. sp. tritici PST-130]|nr:hypothetical protein H4Q26_011117 [Puccinia striiformis f. sp. tritici PST-130]